MKKLLRLSGMTLVELVIASVILMIVMTMVMSVYAGFTSSQRKILLSAEIFNETRFLVERIAREVHNGTIDYQGYWRENLLNLTAENWIFKTDTTVGAEIYESSNPKGALINGNLNPTASGDSNLWGLNSQKNCNDPSAFTTPPEHIDDTDTQEKRMNIIYNYRYQFIYTGRDSDNAKTNNMVHLNCVEDKFDETPTTGKYNVYDDEPAYGRGPRAFDENGYDNSRNYARGSKMLWDWDLKDNAGTPNPIIKNNPPLLLVKSNESNDKFTRTAIRYDENKIKLARFVTPPAGGDNDNPPDGIFDKWMCDVNFECGPSGTTSFDGTYIFSQKEEKKNGGGDVNIGEDNGIGTITDTDIHWRDITPEKIEIIYFDFILSPVKDPHRAFYEKEKIQKPQITIIIEAQAKQSAMKGIKGDPPKIRLQTTVTPRIWDLVEVDN